MESSGRLSLQVTAIYMMAESIKTENSSRMMPTWSTTSTPHGIDPHAFAMLQAVRCGAGETEQASDLNSTQTHYQRPSISAPVLQPEPYLDYGAKFPAKYQNAFFILDWSWGKIHAVHLEPDGSSYKGTKETFITGSPLPVTDIIIHPDDGAMYFTIGGRRVQSGLYRVTHTGNESTKPAVEPTMHYGRILRQKLEKYHGVKHKDAVSTAWPHLGQGDRFIRWAALTAILHQPLKQWKEKALKETDPSKRALLMLGLCKVAADDPANGKTRSVDMKLANDIYQSLLEIKWDQLDHTDKLTLLRAYQIALVRLGKPPRKQVEKIISHLEPNFPAPNFEQNWLLAKPYHIGIIQYGS